MPPLSSFGYANECSRIVGLLEVVVSGDGALPIASRGGLTVARKVCLYCRGEGGIEKGLFCLKRLLNIFDAIFGFVNNSKNQEFAGVLVHLLQILWNSNNECLTNFNHLNDGLMDA